MYEVLRCYFLDRGTGTYLQINKIDLKDYACKLPNDNQSQVPASPYRVIVRAVGPVKILVNSKYSVYHE